MVFNINQILTLDKRCDTRLAMLMPGEVRVTI
jgi:hypothetical protein